MAKVIRYFHLRSGMTGGATAKVIGDTEILGQVDIQVAKCSKKDHYCKNTGRIEASKAPTKVIPLRYLPKELSRIAESTSHPAWDVGDYSYAIKYFLPKE